MKKQSYVNYCWSLGTTTFRVKELREKIPLILRLLKEFIEHNEWTRKTQVDFYDLLYSNELVQVQNKSNEKKSKDARAVTSILVQFGLANKNRQLTNDGERLLKRLFNNNNVLRLDGESYFYLQQLMKFTLNSGTRPILFLIRLLNQYDSISTEEMTYLVPLAINTEKEIEIWSDIEKIHNKELSINDVLMKAIDSIDEYKELKEEFSAQSSHCLSDFEIISMNRKSSSYSEIYEKLYFALKDILIVQDPQHEQINTLKDILKSSSSRSIRIWKELILKNVNKNNEYKIIKSNIDFLFKSIDKFDGCFFNFLHLGKWKANLEDYGDLNKRWLSLTNLIDFSDGNVSLQGYGKIFLKAAFNSKNLVNIDNSQNGEEITSLLGIHNIPNKTAIIDTAKLVYNANITNINELDDFEWKEKYERFNKLVNDKFNNKFLLENIELCKNYALNNWDKKIAQKIQKNITDQVTVPGIFEYLIAVAFYKMSNCDGSVLKAISENLGTDLLPNRFTSSGTADVSIKYKDEISIPEHTLTLEMSLTTGVNQRKAETESVPRHLMSNIIKDDFNKDDYAIFVAPIVSETSIASFRAKKSSEEFLNGHYFESLEIIPLEIEEIEKMIAKGTTYEELFVICHNAYESNLKASQGWFENEVKNKF